MMSANAAPPTRVLACTCSSRPPWYHDCTTHMYSGGSSFRERERVYHSFEERVGTHDEECRAREVRHCLTHSMQVPE